MGPTGFGPKFPGVFLQGSFPGANRWLGFLDANPDANVDVRRVGLLTERKLGAISDPVLLTRMCSSCMLGICGC